MAERRLPILGVMAIAVGAIGFAARKAPEPTAAEFAAVPAPVTPHVRGGDRLSTTYYCAGSPATGEGVSGSVTVVNPGDVQIEGTYTVFVPAGPPVAQPISVGPRSRVSLALTGVADVPYVGATVEFAGNGGVVEQQVTTGAGTSLSPCSTDASTSWYFADGVTLDGDDYDLVLSNPFAEAAIVDMTFVTASGRRTPNNFQSFVVPPQSVRAVDVDGVAKLESQLSVALVSRSGRFVAARAQTFAGSGRSGYSMTLGAPGLGREWNFADGEVGEGIAESVAVFNGTPDPVEVDVVVVPGDVNDAPLDPVTVTVDGMSTQIVDVSGLEGIRDKIVSGRHALLVRTLSTDSVVAERVITKQVDDKSVTGVTFGSQLVSPVWWLPTGVPSAVENGLVVFNTTGLTGTVTVSQIGPGGAVAIPGLSDLPIGGGAILHLDLTAAEAANAALLVTSSGPDLVVEQRPPRQTGPGRSAALAVPQQ